jgi:unsaturated rhamnogalacturonyl hydrolase
LIAALVLIVQVGNDLPIARPSETVEIAAAALKPLGDLARVHVFDGERELLAQTLDIDGKQSLIFQADLPANGKHSFELRAGAPRTYRKEDFRVYGRFVRERFDDFAWENDRIAHRMYGAALETWEKEPLTSSAVDVWLKRTRRLIVNDWYMVDDYHHDHGEGADFYSAGKSRGCGGSGLWRDGKLVVSKNFRESKVLAAGPIRLVFDLRYPDLDETKRITLDAGQNFGRFESSYARHPEPAQPEILRCAQDDGCWATGIKKNKDANFRAERAAGWVRTWEPVTGGEGQFGCAVVLDPAKIADVTESDGNYIVVAKPPASYWVGVGWDHSGDFKGVEDWDAAVAAWARRVASPLRVEVMK